MSLFSHLDQISSRVQDVVNARWARYVPRAEATANPNAAREQDPRRSAMEIEVIFEYNSNEFGMELGVRKSYREANDLRNVSVGRTPDVSIDRRWFPDKDAEPRQGDHIILLKKDELGNLVPDLAYPVFEVMDNQRDGLARFVLRLAQLGSQA